MEEGRTCSTSEDAGISMVDILKEEEELQQDANAVLGAGDDTQCSYNKGYVKRQALYACLTCCPSESGEPAGVCLACSLQCHDDHTLVELYTKRHFKCDCGNSKFKNKCKLNQDREDKNEENKYNQNFTGLYCTCKRPYPDPEMSLDDEMIQCCICEDWYHSQHLGDVSVPECDGYSEMMCQTCASKLPFISSYIGLSVKTIKMGVDESAEVNTLQVNDSLDKENQSSPKSTQLENSSEDNCKLLINKKLELPNGAIFFAEKWRQFLCACDSCKAVYKSLNVEYLLDEEDTVSHYEATGKNKKKLTSVEQELDALSSLDRITRTEMVHEYNTLSSSLREYLRKFAENGKVVRGEDINEFFTELKAKKKTKTGSGFQFTCK